MPSPRTSTWVLVMALGFLTAAIGGLTWTLYPLFGGFGAIEVGQVLVGLGLLLASGAGAGVGNGLSKDAGHEELWTYGLAAFLLTWGGATGVLVASRSDALELSILLGGAAGVALVAGGVALLWLVHGMATRLDHGRAVWFVWGAVASLMVAAVFTLVDGSPETLIGLLAAGLPCASLALAVGQLWSSAEGTALHSASRRRTSGEG